MKLYQEIVAEIVNREGCAAVCSGTEKTAANAVELVCYQALNRIKTVIEDDRLNDESCFRKIEEIVSILEELGSNGGNRHDFG